MRINEISIQNYKCFHDTKIEGFERVNLIGGRNNSGKTVLLEALHLAHGKPTGKLALHRVLRGEKEETNNFDSLFYKNDNELDILISIDNERLLLTQNPSKSNEFLEANKDTRYYEDRLNQLNILKIGGILDGYNQKENFITPTETFLSERLVLDFNKIEEKEQEHQILDFLKIIDKKITDIRVSIQGGAHLRVKKQNEGVVALTALGDAAKKVVRISLCILSGNHVVIFIDEIENGIHYTAHKEFWKLLFYMAQKLNVQVFATTHSLEMIKAFEAVASKEYANEAAYFELFRHGKTQEIGAKKHNMETLNYKLERNLELRGE